jgi:hypothetical protein
VLYGSVARGTADARSDIDVLVATATGKLDGHVIPLADALTAGASSYSWNELEYMHRSGSLFILHLQREGKLLHADSEGKELYTLLLSSLPPYSGVRRDLSAFLAAVDDAESALRVGSTGIEFELASIATTIRHASILGCYLGGDPDFGRYSAVNKFLRLAKLDPGLLHDFKKLYAFRLAQDGRQSSPELPSADTIAEWVKVARVFVDAATELSYATC